MSHQSEQLKYNRRDILHAAYGLTAFAAGPPSSSSSVRPSHSQTAPRKGTWRGRSPTNFKFLGVPHSRELVERGLHPILPERVVVSSSLTRPLDCIKCARIKKRVLREKLRGNWGESLMRMPEEKLALLVFVAERMATYYGRLELTDNWARRLALREELGSSGIGRGCALIHQFQHADCIATDSAVVDWWLFLFPDGAEFESLDGKPVYVALGHVFDRRRIGLEIGVWAMAADLMRACGPFSKELANSTPDVAATHCNQWLLHRARLA